MAHRAGGHHAGPHGTLHPTSVPRRVLLVCADVGDEPEPAAAALQEQVQRLWPGSDTGRLAVIGPRLGQLSRQAYLAGARAVPWLYRLGYASAWRHRWLDAAGKRLCGAVVGRRLAPAIEAFDPDLIASTHPLGTAGLAWLRRRRGLAVPIGGWIDAIAPHPFHLHPEIDLNLLAYPAAVPAATAAAPTATIAVSGPLPAGRSGPAERAAARRRHGLDPARPVVLVAGGSLGLAAMTEAVRALGEDPAGRGFDPAGRRLALLRTGAAPTGLIQAADVLVTNDSGAAVRKALATGTPVVYYRPTAPGAVADAAVLGYAGLAETCRSPQALAAAVGWYLTGAPGPGPAAAPGSDRSAELPGRGLPALAGASARPPRPAPLRSQDALFHYAQTPTVRQQIGAVLDIGPRPDGRPLAADDLLAVLRERVPAITTLRRQLVSRGRWRRPGWRLARRVEVAAHVREYRAPASGGPAAVAAEIDRFWTEPLPTGRPPWQLLLVTGLPAGQTRLALKLHHCLGDGLSAIGTLSRLLGPVPAATASPAGRTGARHSPATGTGRLRQAALLVRGLAALATAGPAHRTVLNRPLATPQRRLVSTVLPAREVSTAARARRAHPSDLVGALVAEALSRTYPGTPPTRLRALFPVSVSARSGARAPTQGNWSGAVALELPLTPMPVAERVDAVRDRLRGAMATGQPAAAALVTRLLGLLPGGLHAAVVRQIYTGRFMNVIVSYVPGPVSPPPLAGAPIRAAVPVVGLADRVPLGVGVLRWGDTFGVGVLLDGSLAGLADDFVAALHAAFDELRVATGGARGSAGPARPAAGAGSAGLPAGAGASADRTPGGVIRCS